MAALFGRLEELKTKFSSDAVKLNTRYLVDFDWKVNLTLSADVIAQCRQPVMLLMLKFNQGNWFKFGFDFAFAFFFSVTSSHFLGSGDQSTQEEVVLELSLEELESVIGNLEGVNTFLNKLQY